MTSLCPGCGKPLEGRPGFRCECGTDVSPFGQDPIDIPVDGVLDLHTFRPSEIKDLVPEFLKACALKGIFRIRIVHGKGSGALMKTVHGILKKTPGVRSFKIAGTEEGGSGATIVRIKGEKSPTE